MLVIVISAHGAKHRLIALLALPEVRKKYSSYSPVGIYAYSKKGIYKNTLFTSVWKSQHSLDHVKNAEV